MTDTFIDSKVQRIQAMLYAKARNEPEVQFKRLYKYLTNLEWIEIATDQVIRNRGSRTAGIDGQTRGDYTCTECGYKSQRQKGEVHDLEVHHINPEGGYKMDNLQTVCIPCHQQLMAIQQAD